MNCIEQQNKQSILYQVYWQLQKASHTASPDQKEAIQKNLNRLQKMLLRTLEQV